MHKRRPSFSSTVLTIDPRIVVSCTLTDAVGELIPMLMLDAREYSRRLLRERSFT
jgi:hypothetical protein